jgi:hypothetical protein
MSNRTKQALAGAAVLGLALAAAVAARAADLPRDEYGYYGNGNGNGNGHPPDIAGNGYPSQPPYEYDRYREPQPFNGGNGNGYGGNGNGYGGNGYGNGYGDRREPYADNGNGEPPYADEGNGGYGNSRLPPAAYNGNGATRNGNGYDSGRPQAEWQSPQYDWRRPEPDFRAQQYGFPQRPAPGPYANGGDNGAGTPDRLCERVVTSSRWDYANEQWVPVYQSRCRRVQAY